MKKPHGRDVDGVVIADDDVNTMHEAVIMLKPGGCIGIPHIDRGRGMEYKTIRGGSCPAELVRLGRLDLLPLPPPLHRLRQE